MWNYFTKTFKFMSNAPEQHFQLLSSFEYKEKHWFYLVLSHGSDSFITFLLHKEDNNLSSSTSQPNVSTTHVVLTLCPVSH